MGLDGRENDWNMCWIGTLNIEAYNQKIHDLPHSKEEQRLVTNQQTLVLVLPVSEELLNQLFNDEEIASTVASWTLESGGK